MFRIIKTSALLIIGFIFISCGGWASKEKSEFIQDCKGGSDKEELISLCKCVYDIVSDEFTYSEFKVLNELPYDSFSSEDNIRLEKITPDIKKCY